MSKKAGPVESFLVWLAIIILCLAFWYAALRWIGE